MTDAPLVLDLADLDVEDGPSLAEWVTQLRSRAAEHPLVICNCPQMLAHTLYKAGLLRDGRIRLESVRDEEPYG